MAEWTRILGIDPGSRVTGFGLLDSNGTGDGELPPRLKAIFDGIRALVLEHEPREVAIEKVFMHKNADSALKLGQARSAAICATFSAGVEIHEYAARAVKQAVVGQGGADKLQVEHMVRSLLRLPTALAPDEADALAVALCHAHSRPLAARLARASQLRVVRR